MYDKIGSKIKGLAKVIFIVEAIVTVITGIALISSDVDIGILVIALGPIIAWVSSWLLYGFGELIDKACDIEHNTRSGEGKSEAQAKMDYIRTGKIEKLRSQGLITEEEYQQAIFKGKQEV